MLGQNNHNLWWITWVEKKKIPIIVFWWVPGVPYALPLLMGNTWQSRKITFSWCIVEPNIWPTFQGEHTHSRSISDIFGDILRLRFEPISVSSHNPVWNKVLGVWGSVWRSRTRRDDRSTKIWSDSVWNQRLTFTMKIGSPCCVGENLEMVVS